MRWLLRVLAMSGALGAIGYGLQVGSAWSDRRWLQALGVAGILLIIAWWPARTRRFSAFNRSLLRLSTILLVGFALISVQLVRVQIVQSERTLERSEVAESGQVIANPRDRLEADPRLRGAIIDRDGNVLAEQVTDDAGTRRVYPEPSVAALLGYYSPALYGTAELEAALDEELSGEEAGNPVSEWLDDILHREQPGYDAQLTIDLELQRQAVAMLGERRGAVVLMDADTGEILVMASTPAYDPNLLYTDIESSEEQLDAARAYWGELVARDDAPLLLRPTDGLYVPGSTFKMVTATALLNEGLAQTDTLFRDEGILEVDGRVIIEQNRPDETRVDWTLEESFAYSLNVVFARIGLELEADLLAEYARRFGIEDELPFILDAATGQLHAEGSDLAFNRALLADTAFGQGELLVTPLHMALIGAGIANDGVIMEPMIVSAILDEDGDAVERHRPDDWRTVMNDGTAEAMHQLMLASAEYGYASAAQIEGLTVGGKTGTAETADGEPHAWFVGYAGDGERTLVATVIVEHGGSGGETALPIGRDLLASAFAS